MKIKEMREQVEKISKNLPPLTEKQTAWVFNKQKEDILKELPEYEKKHGKKMITDKTCFSLYQTRGDWQIDRVFISCLVLRDKHTKFVHKYISVASEWYYNTKTHDVCFMQKPIMFMTYDFNLNAELRFRRFVGSQERTTAGHLSKYYGLYKIPNGRINKQINLRGFNLQKHFSYNGEKDWNWNVRDVMINITTNPFFETLLKSPNWKYVGLSFTKEQQKAFLVCLRHHITIPNDKFSLWKDTITLMSKNNMDWHNPKLLADFENQHKTALRKEEKRRELEKIKKIKDEEVAYVKAHKDYLDITFSQHSLNFHVLASVAEFYDEGKHMHHCVYQMGYYKKKDVLIFSVRDNENKRLATIEYNIPNNKVVQCQGLLNKKPEQYDEILKVFKYNINKLIDKRTHKRIQPKKLKMVA